MKTGVIPMGSLDPKVLAKNCKKMQTVNELFCGEIRDLLHALAESAQQASTDLDPVELLAHVDPVIELAMSIDSVRDHVQLDRPDLHGHLQYDDYSIVVDNKHRVLCVMESPFSSKGKLVCQFVPNSIDMAFPSNDGEECYVLGPEWFPEGVPGYDIRRRKIGKATQRRQKRRPAKSAGDH